MNNNKHDLAVFPKKCDFHPLVFLGYQGKSELPHKRLQRNIYSLCSFGITYLLPEIENNVFYRYANSV